jgi:hypothetical protein
VCYNIKMSEVLQQEITYERLLNQNPSYNEGIQRVYDHWANKSLRDVIHEMPDAEYFPIDDDRSVQLLQVKPDSDIDTTQTIALGLPFLNGITPHHYIRAKSLQLMVNPDATVVMMPNNSHKNEAYQLNQKDRQALAKGDMRPIGAIEMLALEQLNKIRQLGNVSLTGYSQGASTVLAMGAFGSTELHVSVINADEAPSKDGRTTKQLKSDFMAGGVFDVPNEAADADLDALNEAVTKPKFILDVARFYFQSLRKESQLLQGAMAGSVDTMIGDITVSGVPVKLGYVKASPMFDPASIDKRHPNVQIVGYSGDKFARGHAVGDNVIKHAIMAKHGIDLAR